MRDECSSFHLLNIAYIMCDLGGDGLEQKCVQPGPEASDFPVPGGGDRRVGQYLTGYWWVKARCIVANTTYQSMK